MNNDGDPYDSMYDYTLTFQASEFPPVMKAYAGYWSVTAYLGDVIMHMIHNPIDRYKIDGKMEGLVYDDNGALTLYIQKKRATNWLPTPDPEFAGYESGAFHLVMRVYLPKDEGVQYSPPGVIKAGHADP